MVMHRRRRGRSRRQPRWVGGCVPQIMRVLSFCTEFRRRARGSSEIIEIKAKTEV